MTSVKAKREKSLEDFLEQFKQHLADPGPDGVQSRIVTASYPAFHEAMNVEIDSGGKENGKAIFEAVMALIVHMAVGTARGYPNSVQMVDLLFKNCAKTAGDLLITGGVSLASIPAEDMGKA